MPDVRADYEHMTQVAKFEEGYNEFNSGVTQTLEGMNELSQLQEADAG